MLGAQPPSSACMRPSCVCVCGRLLSGASQAGLRLLGSGQLRTCIPSGQLRTCIPSGQLRTSISLARRRPSSRGIPNCLH